MTPLFTRTITGAAITGTTLTIISTMGIAKYSFELVSGTATILGTATLAGLASTAVALAVGVPFNGSSSNQQCEVELFVSAGSVVKVVATDE